MRHKDYQFVDTAFNGPYNRNNPMPVSQVLSAMPDHRKDCHTTWHRFPQAYVNHYENNWKVHKKKGKHQSTANYRGPSYADFLPIDIDNSVLGDALETARKFLAQIDANYAITEGIYCYFSGSKGFHICLANSIFGGWEPSEVLPVILKSLAERLCGDLSFDKSIYSQNGFLRLPNTINGKSGLYKIPLTRDEMLTLDIKTILDMAEHPRDLPKPQYDNHQPKSAALDLYQATVSEHNAKAKNAEKQQAITDLFKIGLTEGDGRNSHLFAVVCELKRNGVKKTLARQWVNFYDSVQKEPLARTDGVQVLEDMVERVYKGVDEDWARITPDTIRSMPELADDYTVYTQSLKDRLITTFMPTVNSKIRGIAPGEVMTVIAKTSVGKTCWLLNLLKYATQQHNTPAVFCSMEQPGPQVFERFAQITTGNSGMYIERNWDDPIYRDRLAEDIYSNIGKKIYTCDVAGLSMDEIEQVVRLTEQKAGEEVGILALDYMGLIDGKDLDRTLYGQVSQIARTIKTLAKSLNVAIIVLCQVSRSADDKGDKPLSLSSARESGAIEESADFILGLYRPYILGENGMDDDTMRVQILKNRKGPLGEVECNFSGQTMTVTERREYFGASEDFVDFKSAASGNDF